MLVFLHHTEHSQKILPSNFFQVFIGPLESLRKIDIHIHLININISLVSYQSCKNFGIFRGIQTCRFLDSIQVPADT